MFNWLFGTKNHLKPNQKHWILLEGKKLGYSDYLLTVQHSDGRIQMYRSTPYPWRTYPQGEPITYEFDFRDWLDQQCIQFEWSQEHK